MIEEAVITETEKGPVKAQSSGKIMAAERPSTIADQTLLLLVTAVVIILDHLTKLYIEIWLPLNTSFQPWPEYGDLFQFTHVSNTGAAFGLFPTGSNIFMVVALVVAVIIIVYNYRLPTGHYLFRIALGLQLGGALGNLVDRLRLGHVTDFMDVGPWPVFNVADASIVAGVLVLVLLMLLEGREQRATVDSEPVLERQPRLERKPAAEIQIAEEPDHGSGQPGQPDQPDQPDMPDMPDQPNMQWND